MRIYFLGICGTAMGNAAILMRALGHEVSGCDTGVYPPMSDVLAEAGVSIHEGFDPVQLQTYEPELVVVGNAISRGNPVIEWLWDTRAFRCVSLPELLRERLLSKRRNIVVCGTHGKTTTSTLAAFLLRKTACEPGWLIGGVPRDLPGGAHLGKEDAPFVIEGDEYDTAFFDKRSKFIHYEPSIVILNNLEFDHADIFRDLADVQRTFNHLLRIVPRKGFVLVNGDDENIEPLLPVSWTQVIRVGFGEHNDLRLRAFKESPRGSSFQLIWRGTIWGKVEWGLPGEYNARNAAMAALAAGLAVRPDDPLCAVDPAALAGFRGVKRRQEALHESDRLTVLSDFAHHPTAIAGLLTSLKARYPEHRLVACFEPRSNTACTNIFQYDFAQALAKADLALLAPVYRADQFEDAHRLDTGVLASDISEMGGQGSALGSNELVFESLKLIASQDGPPLLVVFLSNGAFGGIIGQFAEYAKKLID